MEVGIRELRDHLSQYIQQVEAGDEVVVTDRGRAVARVVPIKGARAIDRLIAEGLVTPGTSRKRRARPRAKTVGTVSDLVADQRR